MMIRAWRRRPLPSRSDERDLGKKFGLDLHARSIAAAAIDRVTFELTRSKLTLSHDHIKTRVEGMPGSLPVANQAGSVVVSQECDSSVPAASRTLIDGQRWRDSRNDGTSSGPNC
jgi:hypothetical protein